MLLYDHIINISLQKYTLSRYYKYMCNFIATTTQPTIFWVPRNFNPKLEQLRENTREFIAQKLQLIANTDYSC